jgi:transposase
MRNGECSSRFCLQQRDRSTTGLSRREIVNGIFCVMRSGYPWRQLPKVMPPWSRVCRWFAAWRDACVFEKTNHSPGMLKLERVGREASPSTRDLS